MAIYRVQLKQGSNTVVNHIEARSVDAVKAFFEAISTMKVTEILKVEYQYTGNTIPVDDFNYMKLFKGFLKSGNEGDENSKQIVIKNLKKTIDSRDILSYAKQHLEVANLPVKSLYCALYKED